MNYKAKLSDFPETHLSILQLLNHRAHSIKISLFALLEATPDRKRGP